MYSNQRATALNHELHQLESEYSTLKQQQDDLKQRVVLHKPTQVKLDKLASLKRDNLIQKETLLSVNRFDKSEQIGYSSVIAALTAIESDDIRVIAVRLNGQGLSLRATASRASAIPAWLSQFKAAVSLVDKGFGRLAISRNHLEATNTGSVTFELTASEHEHQSSREMDNFILDDGGR
jgi:MSHA biogenesis protein MshI